MVAIPLARMPGFPRPVRTNSPTHGIDCRVLKSFPIPPAGWRLVSGPTEAPMSPRFAEMTPSGSRWCARRDVPGLTGIGDIIVTCYSVHSRNNRVGRMLGSGKTLEETIAAMNQVAEGVPNAKNAHELARKLGVRTPLIDQAYEVLFHGKPPAKALRELLERDQRPESD